MNITRTSILILAAGVTAFAQQWEVGGSAGGGFLPTKSIASSLGAASTGFQSGAAFGGFVGQTISAHIGGEIRYTFMQSNLKLSSGGTSTSFSGQAHAVHYDVLLHTNRKGSRTQLFAALGGGMKYFRGTGKESAYQPLSQFAYLTHTQKVEPMASIGGGIRVALSERISL